MSHDGLGQPFAGWARLWLDFLRAEEACRKRYAKQTALLSAIEARQ